MPILDDIPEFGQKPGQEKISGAHSQLLDVFLEKALVLGPEKALLYAMFQGAIHDVDLRWINRRDDDSVIGFDYTCEALGLDPSATRKVLNARLPKKQPPKRIYKREIIIDNAMDEGYSHTYEFQTHCDECRCRYHVAYRRARGSQKHYKKRRA